MFLDTMKEGDSRLVSALLDNDPPQVLEGESRLPNARVEDHQLSWAQWFADSAAPGVQRARWFERRHMTHATRRWNRDHSAELQSAFMNGAGMLVWDAVFGVWVGWNERDKATLRRMLRVQRALTDLFINGEWTPLTDASTEAIAAGVYASRFAAAGHDTVDAGEPRRSTDYTGPALTATGTEVPATEWFDLTAGRRLGHGRGAGDHGARTRGGRRARGRRARSRRGWPACSRPPPRTPAAPARRSRARTATPGPPAPGRRTAHVARPCASTAGHAHCR